MMAITNQLEALRREFDLETDECEKFAIWERIVATAARYNQPLSSREFRYMFESNFKKRHYHRVPLQALEIVGSFGHKGDVPLFLGVSDNAEYYVQLSVDKRGIIGGSSGPLSQIKRCLMAKAFPDGPPDVFTQLAQNRSRGIEGVVPLSKLVAVGGSGKLNSSRQFVSHKVDGAICMVLRTSDPKRSTVVRVGPDSYRVYKSKALVYYASSFPERFDCRSEWVYYTK